MGPDGELLGQELESHPATQIQVLGRIDHAHAPATEAVDDAIVRESLANHGTFIFLSFVLRVAPHCTGDRGLWGGPHADP